MNVLQTALKKSGVKLEGDALPAEQRTVKTFKKVIAAVRAAEADMSDQLFDVQGQLNKTLKDNFQLHERIRELENELIALRLTQRMSDIDSLTVADRAAMLECVSN